MLVHLANSFFDFERGRELVVFFSLPVCSAVCRVDEPGASLEHVHVRGHCAQMFLSVFFHSGRRHGNVTKYSKVD